MVRVGAFEAKTHFAALLDRVQKGERITITRNGRPAAILIPVSEEKPKLTHDEIMARMRAIRACTKSDTMTVKEMINEGRRF
jgi:prevent-host-death family protein